MSIWDYIRSLQCLDFEAFKGIIKEDCVVEYSFNGESFECSGEQFVDRLKEGHFENTTKCEAINFKLHRDHEIENYHVCDETLYTRLGLGKYEDGPGVYYMRSEGFVTFENGKVVKLIMQFEKKKTLK